MIPKLSWRCVHFLFHWLTTYLADRCISWQLLAMFWRRWSRLFNTLWSSAPLLGVLCWMRMTLQPSMMLWPNFIQLEPFLRNLVSAPMESLFPNNIPLSITASSSKSLVLQMACAPQLLSPSTSKLLRNHGGAQATLKPLARCWQQTNSLTSWQPHALIFKPAECFKDPCLMVTMCPQNHHHFRQ